MIHKMGTHHKAMITWNTSIAVRAMKTLTGSQWMLHTPFRQNNIHVACGIPIPGAKTHWTRGASTPPFVSGLMTVKIHVLTLRPAHVPPSQPRLDAPRPDLCPHHVIPLSFLHPLQTLQNHPSPFIEPFPPCDSFPSTRTIHLPNIPFSTAWPLYYWRVCLKTRRNRTPSSSTKRYPNGREYGLTKDRLVLSG